ncbi:hypothetical protein LZ30DRAFT_731964, partial [Colletotrichum cereale]
MDTSRQRLVLWGKTRTTHLYDGDDQPHAVPSCKNPTIADHTLEASSDAQSRHLLSFPCQIWRPPPPTGPHFVSIAAYASVCRGTRRRAPPQVPLLTIPSSLVRALACWEGVLSVWLAIRPCLAMDCPVSSSMNVFADIYIYIYIYIGMVRLPPSSHH